jgi:hypothetical protein
MRAYICQEKKLSICEFSEVLSPQKIIGSANRKWQKIYGPQIANPQITTFAEFRKSKKIKSANCVQKWKASLCTTAKTLVLTK